MKTSSVPHPPAEKVGSVWTILKLLNWTTSYFSSHHIEQARATAEILLAHTLGLKRIDLYLRYDQPLYPSELGLFKAYIKRRVGAEPVAYITGEKEFWSMAFKVTPDVLIPRPDTECLVEAALTLLPLAGTPSVMTVLELGTGTGAIAVALASERQGIRLFASDRSDAAIRIARMNTERLGYGDRIHFFCSDWLLPVRPGLLFDMIVSNPPYIKAAEIPQLQPEIYRYEPHGALDGGPDGLEALKAIINQSLKHLSNEGYLLLEIGHDQKASVSQIAHQSGGYEPVRFLKDYSGIDRVALLRRSP